MSTNEPPAPGDGDIARPEPPPEPGSSAAGAGGETAAPPGPEEPAPDGANPARTTEPIAAQRSEAYADGDAEVPHRAADDTDPAPPMSRRQRRREKRAQRSGFVQWMRELPIMLAIAFLIAVLLRSFVVQAFWIPSGSMEQTLHGCAGCTGDRILVNRMSYWFSDPEPGDIVVFQAPSSWEAEVPVDEPDNPLGQSWLWVKRLVGAAPPAERDLVKRVIATEGQTIECCDAQNRVLVDGKPLHEPYIYLDGQDPSAPDAITSFGPVTVPEGRMFVMGDHRNASADSRAHLDDQYQGTVPVDAVIGRAFVVLWPFDRFTWLSPQNPQASAAQAASAAPLPLLDPPVLAMLLVAPVAAVRGVRRKGQ